MRRRGASPDRRSTIDTAWVLLLWAGLASTLASAWVTAAVRWHGGTRLNPSRMAGCLVRGRPGEARTLVLGFAMRLAGGTLFLPLLYAAIFEWAGRADASVGGLVGVAQALLVGASLPLLFRRGECAEDRPGLFGWRLGAFTPVVLLLSYALYGALLGYIYIVPA